VGTQKISVEERLRGNRQPDKGEEFPKKGKTETSTFWAKEEKSNTCGIPHQNITYVARPLGTRQ